MKTNNIRIDLSDVTFLIPVRVESEERKTNLETLLKIIMRDYITQVIILEADTKQVVTLPKGAKNIKIEFVYDGDPVFHRTKYINQLLQMTQTFYAAVWDTDAIALPKQ